MDTNLIIEALLVILVIVGFLVTGNYYRKKANNLTGWLKWMVGYRGIAYITSSIVLIAVLLYYYFLRK